MSATSGHVRQHNRASFVRNRESGKNPGLKPSRYWEVDTLRGIAIVLMVLYHLAWDLNYFGAVELDMYSGLWPRFARGIATIFIWLVGVSLVFSYSRGDQTGVFLKYLRRGGKVFGMGLLITLATYLFLGHGFVIFGILHLIGFSIVAAYPFLPHRRRHTSLLVGLVFIGLGMRLDGQVLPTPWLIWLGINQTGRSMVDYYPVLPWFGVVLVGIYVGHILYPRGVPRLALPDMSSTPIVWGLSFLGRHSLLIYLIHQPILLGILILLGIGSVSP